MIKRRISIQAGMLLFWIAGLTAAVSAWALSWITSARAIEICVLVSTACCTVWLIRYGLRRRNESTLSALISRQVDQSIASRHSLQDQQLFKEHLGHIIKLLRASRATGGQGAHALSDLPWYLVLGTRGSGKTSLLARSGLSIDNASGVSGEGPGAREHCDWYFSPHAVFIETASRYLDDARSAGVFVNFLKLLKKRRKPVAINGIVLTVSLQELISATPVERLELAQRFSSRVSDYATSLGVIPPIHLVLTKSDLLPGFLSAFGDMSDESRRQPWGVALGDNSSGLGEHYEQPFETLLGRLHIYLHQLSLHGRCPADADALQFANYLMGLSEPLKDFLVQLESGSPFVNVRSVHFTSARQGSDSLPAVFKERMVAAYGLKALEPSAAPVAAGAEDKAGYFITDLFCEIILPGRHAALRPLPSGRSSRPRRVLKGLLLTLGVGTLALVVLDFLSDHKKLQTLDRGLAEPPAQMHSPQALRAWQALGQLRAHLSSLDTPPDGVNVPRLFPDTHGLEAVRQSIRSAVTYQLQGALGRPLEKYLRVQLGVLEGYSQHPIDVNNPGEPHTADTPLDDAGAGVRSELKRSDLSQQQRASIADTYEALKLYQVLTDPRAHPEVEFVAATLSRVWQRTLAAEGIDVESQGVVYNSAAYLTDLTAARAPELRRDAALVSALQRRLKSFMTENSWAERGYLRLQLEFKSRQPALTLADLVPEAGRKQLYSSASVPALYTLEGWKSLQLELVKWLAREVRHDPDWVLEADTRQPENIQRTQFLGEFLQRYKNDYAQAWYRFLRETGVRQPDGLQASVQQLSRMSDVQNSPVKVLMQAVHLNTRWDLPLSTNDAGSDHETPAVSPLTPYLRNVLDGSLATRFAPVSQLFAADDPEGGGATIMDRYLLSLRKLKARTADILRSQNVGKSSKRLVSDTLDGQPTEIAAARQHVERYVDTSETGVSVELRRMFSSPVENTWSALRQRVGVYVADEWQQQIVQPWQKTVAHRYPIVPRASNEVSVKDVARFVRPDSGLVAAFKREQMGNLAEAQGLGDTGPDKPQALVTGHVLASIGKANVIGELLDSLADPDNGFELMVTPSSAYTDIIFTLDGQQVHYRNGKERWHRFIWPALSDVPGARLEVVTLEGKRVSVFNFPGRWGLLKMSESAQVSRLDEVRQQFAWSSEVGPVSLTVRNHGGMKLTELSAIKSLNFVSDSRPH
jgi:type VI secretion system protein ImpL